MAPSMPSSSSWLSFLFAAFAVLSFSVPANALYFYMDGRQTKCFFEDLPKDTLVVGTSRLPLSWSYEINFLYSSLAKNNN